MRDSNFENFILDNDIIGFFDEPITLKSGRTSHFYVNWRHATIDAFLLDQVTDYLAAFITASGISWDSIYGVPEGASKTAVITAFKLAKAQQGFAPGSAVIPMGRAKPKDHGRPEDRFFIGKPRGRTIVIEDTTTTGLSLLQTLESLKEAEVEVVAAIGLTDRCEKRDDGLSVQEAVAKFDNKGIPYLSMAKAIDLLPEAARRKNPSSKVTQALSEEFQRYGVSPLQWEG